MIRGKKRLLKMAKILASKEYWDKIKGVSRDFKKKGVFEELFSRYLKNAGKNKVAIEIGCVPGLYLAYVCKNFGYFPEGIDFVRDSEKITGQTLRNFGLNKYRIHTKDFLEWKPARKYDLVLSFGFIEHFLNPDEIIKRHIKLLKKGSKIILEVPNFGNGQKCLHYCLDRENLSRHNTKVMNTSYFKGVAKKYNLKIDYLGYYGGLFNFWQENENANIAQKIVYYILTHMGNITKKISLNNKYFSPYLIMVAEKK